MFKNIEMVIERVSFNNKQQKREKNNNYHPFIGIHNRDVSNFLSYCKFVCVCVRNQE